ncbi:MAG: hypothetical protein R2822_28550 [Spirosomataceae bacterium]
MKKADKNRVLLGVMIACIVGNEYFLGQKQPHTYYYSPKALPQAKATIVYFGHFSHDRYEDQQIQLRLERRSDNQLYLMDDAKNEQGRTAYYTLNGTVNPTDARQLTQKPILPNRWIHLVKYLTEVSNVNSESWLTSAFNVATGQTKYAAVAEVIFTLRDSLNPLLPPLAYTQPLWPHNEAIGDISIFKLNTPRLPCLLTKIRLRISAFG